MNTARILSEQRPQGPRHPRLVHLDYLAVWRHFPAHDLGRQGFLAVRLVSPNSLRGMSVPATLNTQRQREQAYAECDEAGENHKAH